MGEGRQPDGAAERMPSTVTRRKARSVLGMATGKPVRSIEIAVDMAMFSIGSIRKSTNRKGEAVMKTEYALHIQCPWRIVRGGRVLFGYRDYLRRSHPLASRDRLDELVKEFLASKPKWGSVQLRRAGSLVVGLTGEQTLEVFPHGTSDEHGSVEFWRFLNLAPRSSHLVCESIGYYLD